MKPDSKKSEVLEGYAHSTVRGMSWTTVGVIWAKFASLLSQIALGWLLAPEDFVIYALAVSLSTVVGAFQHAGLNRVLVQRGDEFDSLARPCLYIALCFNVVAAIVLLLVGAIAARFYSQSHIIAVVAFIALAIPLSTPGMVYAASLTSQMRFREIAGIGVLSTMLRYGCMVGFAYLEFGSLSFVAPLPLVALFEWLTCRKVAAKLPKSSRRALDVFRDVIRSSRWVMVASAAVSITQFGDYMTVGRVRQSLLAPYFFGYQLVNSVIQLFSSGLLNVLVPAFSKLEHDATRRERAFGKSVRVLALVMSPMSFAIMLLAPPIIHITWQGKWDASIEVVRIMSIVLPLTVLTPLAVAALQASGKWATIAGLLWIHAATTVIAACIGATSGDLVGLASAVSVQHAVNGIIQLWRAGRAFNCQFVALLRDCMLPYSLAALCTFGVIQASAMVGSSHLSLQASIVCVAFLIVAVTCLYQVAMPEMWREIRQMVVPLISRSGLRRY